MKINTKIKLSFLLYIAIPLSVITASIMLVMISQKESMERSYGIEIEQMTQVFNNSVLLDKISNSAVSQVNEILKANEKEFYLDNDEYLEMVDQVLDKKYSTIIITKSDKLQFIGEGLSEKIVDVLPRYDELRNSNLKTLYVSDREQFIIYGEKFEYQDKSKGVIYVVTRTDIQIEEVRILVMEIIVIAILIFILTAMILTIWLYNTVMKPLRSLEQATKKIANGELDFVVKKYEDDEFGDLSDSFEVMRAKLKESVEANMLYDRESKELISNISHDLKTPITTIKGYVEGLLDGVANTPEKQMKYLKTIYNKSVDMDRLISELTLYSQIDTNKIPYNFVKMNIDSYLREFYEEVSIDLEQKDIKITYENLLHKEQKVLIDPEQLRRVLNNIVGNSVKYIDKTPGKVDIIVRDSDNAVKISIADNGKGIEQKDIEKIFERFYRTDASRNSKKGGSGIGLAIVKKIVEAHKGEIWAESVYEEGTTIHFTIMKSE